MKFYRQMDRLILQYSAHWNDIRQKLTVLQLEWHYDIGLDNRWWKTIRQINMLWIGDNEISDESSDENDTMTLIKLLRDKAIDARHSDIV